MNIEEAAGSLLNISNTPVLHLTRETTHSTVNSNGNTTGAQLRAGKSFCYTLNNPTEDDIEKMKAMDCSYHVFGEEVGDNGTPHLQGCITFRKTKRFSALKKVCPRAHWENCIELEAARLYCLKGGKFFINDNRKQGHRSDLDAVVADVREGGVALVKKNHPREFIKFHGGIKALSLPDIEPRDINKPPHVYWFYGPTGCGKTSYVYRHWGPDKVYSQTMDCKWWDGYTGQEVILFDDFRGTLPFHVLLKMLDRYPYMVQCKGGSMHLNSPFIYITSSKPPYEIYQSERINEDIAQLLRRCERIGTWERDDAGVWEEKDVTDLCWEAVSGDEARHNPMMQKYLNDDNEFVPDTNWYEYHSDTDETEIIIDRNGGDSQEVGEFEYDSDEMVISQPDMSLLDENIYE